MNILSLITSTFVCPYLHIACVQAIPPRFAHDPSLEQVKKSAQQGKAKAENGLGVAYATGLASTKRVFLQQDYAKAAYWWRKAADQGLASAEYNLGILYNNGEGVPQDYVKTAYWWRKAADQGLAAADDGLGALYEQGQGVPQDYARAAFWCHKGAEQGDGESENDLGSLYQKGQGVPQSYAKAYFWFDLAAAQGIKTAASNRDIVAHMMTPSELAEAQRRASAWKPK